VAALRGDGHELRLDQAGEVRAHGLLGDARDPGELRGGERLAAEEGREDVGTRPVANERRDADDVRTVFHFLTHGSMLGEPFPRRKRHNAP
jgi:hypothetical protein